MDRSILNRATESTDAPTPGYLYLDIAKNAASSPVACQDIAQYLTARLSNKANANIKHKCLKVISKTAVSPVTRGQFKRMLAQDANAVSAIKDALQFRGPPDPARGDEPYQKVRTAAKEALDAIYSDAPSSSMDHYQATGSAPQMQGIGSGSNNSSNRGFQTNPNSLHQPPPASGTGRRMEGIGNPQFKDPRLEQGFDIGNMTIGDIAKEATQTLSNMIKDPLARNVEMPPAYGNNNSRNVSHLLFLLMREAFWGVFDRKISSLSSLHFTVRSPARKKPIVQFDGRAMEHGIQSWPQCRGIIWWILECWRIWRTIERIWRSTH
jgi:hypothetical protein